MTMQLEMNLQDDAALGSPSEAIYTPAIRFKGFSSAWENRKLETVFNKIRNAFVGTATPYYVEDGHFYLESNNVKNGTINRKTEIFINDEFYKKQSDKWLRTGDIVMVQSGHVGHTAVIPPELDNIAAHALIMFTEPKEKTNPYFVNFQFQTTSCKKKLSEITTGNTIKHILASEMKDFCLRFSDHQEQTAIGNYFQQLDSLIAQHQHKHTKLLNLKQALLQKMFPKQGATVPEVRFKGFSGDWEVKEFGEIVSRKNVVCKELGLPRVEYEDIISGKGTLNKDVRQKENTKTGIKFDQDDVLYGKLRPYLKNWLFADFEGIAVGDFWVLCANEQDSKFIYSLIQTPEFEKTANLSSGSKMPRSDWGLVSKTEFYTPITKDEQTKIGQLFQQLDHLITQQHALLTKLGNLKQAYLAKMFI